jgi:predicted nucleic acid-binding protein
MAPKTSFLDANILLEIVLGRAKETVVREFLEKYGDNLFISALTAHLVVHFGQSIVDQPTLRTFLTDYTMLGLESSDFEWAFTNSRDKDFEDALQLAVAVRNGCNLFVTLDKKLVSTYKDLMSIDVRLIE